MSQIFSASQLRAARALLNWSRADLAEQSGVSEPTIHRFENNNGEPEVRTQEKMGRVFEAKGIEFLDNLGVRFKPEGIDILNGHEGFKKLMDDVYLAACDLSAVDGRKPIFINNVDDRLFMKHLGDYMLFHVQRMNDLKKVKVHILARERDFYAIPDGHYIEYRRGSKHADGNVPFYVFGDNLALISFNTDPSPKIMVIRSPIFAEAYRIQFKSMWSTAKEPPRRR